MKRLIAMLLALALLLSFTAFAEEAGDDGDDSNPQPVDMMEDEELEEQEENLPAALLQYGDEGEGVLALQKHSRRILTWTRPAWPTCGRFPSCSP